MVVILKHGLHGKITTIPYKNAQRKIIMHMCTLHIFKNISCEPISYNTKISIDGVEWGRVNIWIVFHISFKVV